MTRVLFYVQHLLGIGHLARASRIARALADRQFEVTLVTGGVPVPGFPGPGIATVQLPAIKSSDEAFASLIDAEGNEISETFKAHRREKLLSILQHTRPAVLIIEAFPFGRRQMRFELVPLLEAAHAMKPRPLIATSIRDILQEQRKQGRAQETVETIQRLFDLVLVHADPAFIRLEDTFPLSPAIMDRIEYTGLVAGPEPQPGEKFSVIVSAGGGAAGRALIEAALQAARQTDFGKWCILTGPNFTSETLTPPAHVSLFSFRPDFPSLLAAAELSISQAGYNTVCDLLRARCRAILIPFAAHGETEQTRRAQALAGRGLAVVIREAELDAASLAASIKTTLSRPRPSATKLNLEGAANTAAILRRRLQTPPPSLLGGGGPQELRW
jgi:predicted glycosyltransferase